MLVYMVLLHIQCTPIPVFQCTWYYHTFNATHQHLYVSLPGITTHTILYTSTCMLVYLVLLHIQYYSPIPVCQSTWYYYTYNTIHQYLYVSLPGITTHTILCSNTCMLVYLVLLHIQYYTQIPVYQSTWYKYTYNNILQYLYVSLPGITTPTILYTNTCILIYPVLLHIQYYIPILLCQSTWYYYTYNTMHQYLYVSLPGYYTYNTMHQYLYVSLPGITTHAIL